MDESRSRLSVLSTKETRLSPSMYRWTHEVLHPVCSRFYSVCHSMQHDGESILEVVVHVSSNTCLNILCFFGREHTKSAETFILMKRRSYSLCFKAYSYVSGSVGLGKGRWHYVTTHNSTDHCRANHEASLVTQIIRLTCRWVEHSKAEPTLEAAVHVSNNTCFEII
ncbi:hypothetical protein PoB_005458200 [Plakobranchus ocellatus]|uniref:Uncharacterized protein n=1 Tax=Plakobranchus ocellatus TaxID=259542 RepID=A0AAV4C955_9GAST|nr:hypothetical protein PoB_005458200 [Plakobranchus ocellatus]